jgi:hypothetical protein
MLTTNLFLAKYSAILVRLVYFDVVVGALSVSVDDAYGSFLLLGREFAIVEPDLRRPEGIDVQPYNRIFLSLMPEDEIGPFPLLNDIL